MKKTVSKRLFLAFVLFVGGLVNAFAGEGVVLYAKPSPSGRYIYVYVDTNKDGVEDTIVILTGTLVDQSINRRMKENVVVQFDDRGVWFDGSARFYYMYGRALTVIDDKPAQPNPQQTTQVIPR